MKKLLIIFISFFSLNCNVLNRREKIVIKAIEDYESFIYFMEGVSHNWEKDKLGLNGYRANVSKDVIFLSKNIIKGIHYNSLQDYLGLGNKSYYTENIGKITEYYLNRIPTDTSMEIQGRMKMIIEYGIGTSLIESIKIKKELINKEKTIEIEIKEDIIPEYEKCKDYLDAISYYWKNDTNGLNGFRSSAAIPLYEKYQDQIIGMSIDSFTNKMGFGDKSQYTTDEKIKLFYFTSRIPWNVNQPIAAKTKLWVEYDLNTKKIVMITGSMEEW